MKLDKLPAKYRLPLILHYFGGLKPEDMAKELGCKPSTLGVRLHRGRKAAGGKSFQPRREHQRIDAGCRTRGDDSGKRARASDPAHNLRRRANGRGNTTTVGISSQVIGIQPHRRKRPADGEDQRRRRPLPRCWHVPLRVPRNLSRRSSPTACNSTCRGRLNRC